MAEIYGFGAERIDPRAGATRGERQKRSRMMLSRALNLRTLVAFVGSGVSVPLGYPSWHEFAEGMLHATRKALESLGRRKDDNLHRLAEIERRLKKRNVEPRHLQFYIGLCRRLSKTMPEDVREFYRRQIEKTFGPERRHRSRKNNPYAALLDLPITRFVTTNYDIELELALINAGRGTPADYRLDPKSVEPFLTHARRTQLRDQAASAPTTVRSFTHASKYHKELAGFAVAGVPGMRDAVFHCHGRYDEPSDIVATEHDYQKWYLADEDEAQNGAFRQSIELLFGSNPVLFVGYGMGDEDLLRPLRMFNAVNLQEKHSRLLFALVPESSDPRQRDENDAMLERYGVHVIPYAPPVQGDWGQSYCEELQRIGEAWKRDAEEWLKKPAIRKVVVDIHPPTPYRHYAPDWKGLHELAPSRLDDDLRELRQRLNTENRRIVVVTGSGGAGKSWRALRLIEQVQATRGPRRTGIFFWSSYYTDDWLTGIDRALAYLETTPGSGSRIERFAACLTEQHLLIFDGFERLLQETDDTKTGTAENRHVRRLLELAVHGSAKVVITTRLVPDLLRNCFASGEACELAVRQLTAADLLDRRGVFGKMVRKKLLDESQLSAICALCDGHSYALALAASYLGRRPDRTDVHDLEAELARSSPTHRLSHIIELVVNSVNPEARQFLARLAIFMSPVNAPTLRICLREALRRDVSEAEVAQMRDLLLEKRLLFRVSTLPATTDAYTVHPTVRAYVYKRFYHAPTDKLPNFALAGYTSGNAAVAPGDRESAKPVEDLFMALAEAAEKNRKSAEGKLLCRAAWGVFRSRFEANTATRWGTYAQYIRHGIRMAMLAKSIAAQRWSYADRTDNAAFEHHDGPLYADELAWLYSDVGLAIYSEGNIADTYAVWELSYEINRVTDSEEEGGQYIVQSRLHMAGVYLEMGKLPTASEYLTLCDRANKSYKDDDYAARVTGYRGLIQHLRADDTLADKLYGDALGLLAQKQRNMRALSIFQRHRAALKMAHGEPKLAWALVRASRSAAEDGEYADLIGYARSMHGHLATMQKKHVEAQHEFDAALHIARTHGIRRLECEVLCEMSRLALSLGDWQTARARATASLMIANELSLGLRRTHGLVVLGLATVKAGKPELGAAYLRHAHRLAREQHYLLRAREAEAALRHLGQPPPDVL
ncbi:MAG TPA: SIR2 family protein [Thermoanaerobaculia bacterium]|nr:SIR2 family protein [Thermoanaerobaculia bacterium]